MAPEKTVNDICLVPAAEGRQWLRPADERKSDFGPVQVVPSPEDAGRIAAQCLATVECRWCDVCQLLCPDLCITRDPLSGEIRFDLEYCKGCGLCAQYCPKSAIRMVVEGKDGDD